MPPDQRPAERERPAAPAARGKNPGRSRTHNRRVILDLLRRHGQLGRQDLARMTELSAQAVTNIAEGLVADGLVLPTDRLRGGRGQPPLQYAINPNGAFTIGMELAVTRLVTAVVDLGGAVRHDAIERLERNDPGFLLPHIAARVAALGERFDGRLIGVGLVMPGPFAIEGLSGVGPTALPGWEEVDAATELGRLTGVPVEVENDANAAAIGETQLGAGQGMTHVAVIYFGTGLGLGVVAGNAPMRGAHGNAGEVGHVVVQPGGRPCPCGQRGCLERYASPHALRERLAALGLPTRFDDLARLHREDHPAVAAWTDEAALHLAPMVAMLENVLDPETVILAGGLPEGLLDALIERLDLPPSVSRRRERAVPRVIRGRTGRLTAALGAAALPLHSATTPRLDMAEPANPWLDPSAA